MDVIFPNTTKNGGSKAVLIHPTPTSQNVAFVYGRLKIDG